MHHLQNIFVMLSVRCKEDDSLKWKPKMLYYVERFKQVSQELSQQLVCFLGVI